MFRSFLPFLCAVAVLHAQHGITTGNPFSGPEDQAAGGRIFRSQCASCHSRDGSGSSAGPDLTTGSYKHGASDEALYRVITKGVPGTPMTGFALNGREALQLIAFLRSLSIGKGAGKVKGDPARGGRLFETSGCVRCHAVSGKGGFVGPDLSTIGARRSYAQLERSLLDPNAEIAPDYWSLSGKTKSGEIIAGIRLNEDTDSFQIVDSAGRLRSLLKNELAEYEIVRTSPMPSFKGKLQGAELDDVIAYLASLRDQPENRGARQ